MVSALNGSPLTLAFAEVYTGLETGVIDGVVTGAEGIFSNRVSEIIKTGSLLGAMYPAITYAVREDVLAELPADVGDAFLGLMEEKYDWFQEGNIKAEGMALQAMILQDFVKIHPVPKSFREEIRGNAYETMWEPWMERSGPDGVEAFNKVAEVLIDMGYTVPGYMP